MKFFKKALAIFFAMIFVLSLTISAFAVEIKNPTLELNGKSAILMDANTGTILYEKNSDERLHPASVTKIMTLLLVFEAIEANTLKLDDELSVSENAASMGGSQIFLEPNEVMKVEDLLKSVIIASANDAALTLAEHVAGSEEAFVEAMNKRALELGMSNTHFENVTGLDDDTENHLTTAKDIALMSRELLKHEKITEYTTIWMDTIRNGEFGLTNTNRLVRFYRGITGLKTGSTSKAGFCVSASAKRGELHLIAVIMGAESSDERNVSATKLLDFGFSNYEIYVNDNIATEKVKVYGGVKDFVDIAYDKKEILINKGNNSKIQSKMELCEFVEAPIKVGDIVGKIIYTIDDECIGESDIYASEDIEKISFWQYMGNIIKNFLLK
ncbi:MAG: D-alanyl-D-alanine carboxypeptidase [Clostridia bacterium]|nr:D-alanyl-D-alanine carboxypeptidase [Clostridia bacterium]